MNITLRIATERPVEAYSYLMIVRIFIVHSTIYITGHYKSLNSFEHSYTYAHPRSHTSDPSAIFLGTSQNAIYTLVLSDYARSVGLNLNVKTNNNNCLRLLLASCKKARAKKARLQSFLISVIGQSSVCKCLVSN